MDAKQQARDAEKHQLLRRLAELAVEEQREQGLYKSVPHYSQLEQAARSLGREGTRRSTFGGCLALVHPFPIDLG